MVKATAREGKPRQERGAPTHFEMFFFTFSKPWSGLAYEVLNGAFELTHCFLRDKLLEEIALSLAFRH
jgi:hypothetical protein